MKLKASPVGDNNGMSQIQNQLAKLTIQLVEIIKGKEKQEQFWCTKCRNEFHHKDECTSFA
jgi:rRNA maturation endonuclease Nob1